MPDKIDYSVWSILIGWVFTLFGGGVALGKHQQKIAQHDKLLLNIDKLMTEEKCEKFHLQRQETTNVILKGIQSSLKNVETNISELANGLHKTEITSAELVTNMKNLSDRLDRCHFDK